MGSLAHSQHHNWLSCLSLQLVPCWHLFLERLTLLVPNWRGDGQQLGFFVWWQQQTYPQDCQVLAQAALLHRCVDPRCAGEHDNLSHMNELPGRLYLPFLSQELQMLVWTCFIFAAAARMASYLVSVAVVRGRDHGVVKRDLIWWKWQLAKILWHFRRNISSRNGQKESSNECTQACWALRLS